MKLKIEATRESVELPTYISSIPQSFEDALTGKYTPVVGAVSPVDTILRTLILHRELTLTNFAVTPEIREIVVNLGPSPFLTLPTKEDPKFIFEPKEDIGTVIEFHIDAISGLLAKLGGYGLIFAEINTAEFIKDPTIPDLYVLMALSMIYLGLLTLEHTGTSAAK